MPAAFGTLFGLRGSGAISESCVSLQSLTEEKISLLLHLIEEELERKSPGEKMPVKLGSDLLQVHVPACVLALCGWTCRSV